MSNNDKKSMHELLMESFNKQEERIGMVYEPPVMNNESITESNETSLATSGDPAISIMESDQGDVSVTSKPAKDVDRKMSSKIRKSTKRSLEPAGQTNTKGSQIGRSQENSHATKSLSNSYSNGAGVLDQDTQ